jgi:hypothetical protein
MLTKTPSAAEILDRFDDCNFVLTFIESSLRSLIQSGNIGEQYVDDGLAVLMLGLIRDYQNLKVTVQNCLLSAASDTDMAKPDDQKYETGTAIPLD